MHRLEAKLDKYVISNLQEVEFILLHLEKAWELTLPGLPDVYGFSIRLGGPAETGGRFLVSEREGLQVRVILKVQLDARTLPQVREEILRHLGIFFWAALFLGPEPLWRAVRRTVLLPDRRIGSHRRGALWRMMRGEDSARKQLEQARPSKLPFLKVSKARWMGSKRTSFLSGSQGFVLKVKAADDTLTEIHLHYIAAAGGQ